METTKTIPLNEPHNNSLAEVPLIKERIKNFSNYAIQKAGLNNGDATSLRTFLKWIKDGYIVDETYNEKEHETQKKKTQQKISEAKEEQDILQSEKKTTEQVIIPSEKQKIKELEEEIQNTKLDLENKKINTGFQLTNYIMYASLVVLLGFYLIFFYASAIYAAFFRSAASLIELAGNDIILFLNTIFDIKGIFTWSPTLIFVYLGAFIFFAVGIIPHTVSGKYKTLKMIGAILVALLADVLLAYKIDLGIHELKVMAGMADENWYFLTSINFYLVLVFGFLVYLLWGYMYELMIKEKNKKNAAVCAEIIIKGLKKEIRELKNNIKTLEAKVIELESKIDTLQQRIEQMKKDLEKAMINPDLLSQNLTSFYMGWRQFLNGSEDFETKKVDCENAYQEFMSKNFIRPQSLN